MEQRRIAGPGLLASLAVPAGWLALQALGGRKRRSWRAALRHRGGRWPWVRRELGRNRHLYAYLTAGPAVVMGLLSLVFGRRQARLQHEVERLATLSMTDPGTGLGNRRHLFLRLTQAMAESRRNAHSVGLLVLDLDDFKKVNDTHGHPAGDIVLRAVARALASDARTEDLVARYGGEEFALVLPGADTAGALARAERLRRRIRALRVVLGGGTTVQITASFGVAAFPDLTVATADDLFAAADRALFVAKGTGRDRSAVVGAPWLSEGAHVVDTGHFSGNGRQASSNGGGPAPIDAPTQG